MTESPPPVANIICTWHVSGNIKSRIISLQECRQCRKKRREFGGKYSVLLGIFEWKFGYGESFLKSYKIISYGAGCLIQISTSFGFRHKIEAFCVQTFSHRLKLNFFWLHFDKLNGGSYKKSSQMYRKNIVTLH